MTLHEILKNNERIALFTDKHLQHDYIPVYEKLMSPYRDRAKNVLEVGICNGGSLALWKKYFKSATIIGLDSTHVHCAHEFLFLEGVMYRWGSAYEKSVLDSLPEFDIGIDDGPHTLETMTFFVAEYSKKVAPGGMLIVEDVQDYSWFEELQKHVPANFKSEIIDIRANKNRYDDMMFVLRRVD